MKVGPRAVRAHAFPPKDPNGAPPATVERMYYNPYKEDGYNSWRKSDEREGGRMHGHRDESGTDGVVLLNLGSCDFFFDIGIPSGGCTAQCTKECWCVGNGGHWATKADCPPDRYDDRGRY